MYTVMNISGEITICMYPTNNITIIPNNTHKVICKTLEYAANAFLSTTLIIITQLITTINPTIIKLPKFQTYRILNFSTAPANTIEPTIDASTCTFGNHICTLNIGNFAIPNNNNIKPIITKELLITTANLIIYPNTMINTLALPRS